MLKNFLAIAVLLAAIGSVNASPWPLEIIDHLDETKIVIYIKEADIEASPLWNPASGTPTFGLSELLETVAAWKEKNKWDAADGIEKIELKPIMHHEKEGRWYYLVQLKNVEKGKRSHQYLAVLMSGKAVAAIMEPEAYK